MSQPDLHPSSHGEWTAAAFDRPFSNVFINEQFFFSLPLPEPGSFSIFCNNLLAKGLTSRREQWL